MKIKTVGKVNTNTTDSSKRRGLESRMRMAKVMRLAKADRKAFLDTATEVERKRVIDAERQKIVDELLPSKNDKVVDEGAISERPLQASPVSSGDEAGKEDKYLTQIDQFYGTTRYYNVMGTQVTDGVKYLMDNGYSWVVTDAVAVLQTEPKVMGKKFVSIKLKRDATGECVIRYEDGNEKLLYQQKYSYTDAKVDVQMFYENGVLLLPSEH